MSIDACVEVLRRLMESSRIAVVHHWDCDGVASSAILKRILRKTDITFFVPRIGVYDRTALPTNGIRSIDPDIVLVLDYCLDPRQVEEVAKSLAVTMAIVDHHVVEGFTKLFCNPVALGLPEDRYPSTTYVLYQTMKAMGMDVDGVLDLVALGVVADVGWRRGFDLSKLLPDHGYSLEELMSIAEAVDSCYRLGDYECIDHAREKLVENPRDVLRDPYLQSRREFVRKEIEKAKNMLEPRERRGVVLVFELKTRVYATSALGRYLANLYPRNVIVLVNYVESLGISYVYVRSSTHYLRHALEELRFRKLRVGGKDRVFVVTCTDAECGEEVRIVIEVLEKHVPNPR